MIKDVRNFLKNYLISFFLIPSLRQKSINGQINAISHTQIGTLYIPEILSSSKVLSTSSFSVHTDKIPYNICNIILKISKKLIKYFKNLSVISIQKLIYQIQTNLIYLVTDFNGKFIEMLMNFRPAEQSSITVK